MLQRFDAGENVDAVVVERDVLEPFGEETAAVLDADGARDRPRGVKPSLIEFDQHGVAAAGEKISESEPAETRGAIEQRRGARYRRGATAA